MSPLDELWLEQLAKPLEGGSVGSDIRYHENFLQIKTEIEKLTQIDYELILRLAKKLLLETSKDLRLASYFVVAATYVDGASGLIAGLNAYQILLEKFGADLYPKNLTAKIATIQWLNNSRLLFYLEEKKPSAAELAILQSVLQTLSHLLKDFFPAEQQPLVAIEQWVRKKQQLVAAQQQAVMPQNYLQQKEVAPYQINQAHELTTINEVETLASKIIQFLQQQEQWLSAAAYARALRWSTLKIPLHEATGMTAIPPPRAAGLTQLQSYIAAGNPHKLYLFCEALFLEPSGYLLLDLQFHAYQAACALEWNEIAIYLSNEAKGLLERLPKLLELSFANQLAFASSETQSWVQELSHRNAGLGEEEKADIENYQDLGSWLALVPKQEKNFKSILKKILIKTAKNNKEKLLQHLALAQVCLQHKKFPLAITHFEISNSLIAKHELTEWEPDLVAMVWFSYHKALQLQLRQQSNQEEKKRWQFQLQELERQLIQLNPLNLIKLSRL